MKVNLRPIRSPRWPKKTAPNGRTTNPVQKMPRLDEEAVAQVAGKKCVAKNAASTP